MRLHPLSAVTRSLQRGVLAASFVFFLGAIGGGFLPDGATAVGALIVLAPLAFALGVAYQVAYYYRFEYTLTPDTLDIDAGVIGRKEREIPYRRVQNVDVTESIVHRLLGVAVVNVETAGGSETEAVLDFVAEKEARRLQREIRERRAAAQGQARQGDTDSGGEDLAQTGLREPAEEGLATPIFSLDVAELLVLSLSSFKTGTVLFLLFGLPFVQDYVMATLARLVGAPVDPGTVMGTPDLALVAGLILIAMGVLTAWVVSALLTFSEYYEFTLGRQGEDLVYERGLLQRYSGSIPTDKVQTITLTENVLMRRLGYAGLTVETAGYGPGQSGEGAQAAIPLAGRARTLSLARDLQPFGDLSFQRAPKRARRRYAVRYLLVVAALLVAFRLIAVFAGEFSLWPTPLVLVPFVPVAAHLKWKHRGYAAGEEYFVVRSGFWTRSTRVVPYFRLQTVIRERSIFQRRLGLAHLTADTATSSLLGRRDATAYDIDAAEARRLYEVNRDRLQASLGK